MTKEDQCRLDTTIAAILTVGERIARAPANAEHSAGAGKDITFVDILRTLRAEGGIYEIWKSAAPKRKGRAK